MEGKSKVYQKGISLNGRHLGKCCVLLALGVAIMMLNPYVNLVNPVNSEERAGHGTDTVQAGDTSRPQAGTRGPTDPPTNLDIGLNGNDIHLRWDDMGSDGYNIYRATSKWAAWKSGWTLLGGGNPTAGISCSGGECTYTDTGRGNMTSYPPSGPAASDYFYIMRSYHSSVEVDANSTLAYKIWVHRVPNNGTYGTTQNTDNMVINLPTNTTTSGYDTLRNWCEIMDPPVGSSQPAVSSCNKWRERTQSFVGTFYFDPPGPPPPGWGGSANEPLYARNGTMVVLKDSMAASATHALD
jgi:hypothetical protein